MELLGIVPRLLKGVQWIALGAFLANPPRVSAGQPDVVFIVADDLNVTLGCYGSPLVKTPHLDALASRSVVFEGAYCQQALCNPSRASFLTGRRPHRLRVNDLTTHFRAQDPETVTIPQYFRSQGYKTYGIGKIFHNTGDLGDPEAWSSPPEFHEGRHSDDTVFARTTPVAERRFKAPVDERKAPDDPSYWDSQIATRAAEVLATTGRETPLFLAVGFWRPHLPFVAPEEYWDLYEPGDFDVLLPAGYPPTGVPPIALHGFREIRGYGGVPKKGDFSEALVRRLHHGYHASASYLDAQVGRVLEAIESSGRGGDTVVVFVSDHGFHLGELGLWCKTSNFENDARVPLLVSAPGVSPGRSESIVELIDLFPTLTELCGLPDYGKGDGRSLIPVLKNPTVDRDGAAYTEHPRPAYFKKEPDVMGRSVRTRHFRFTEWRSVREDEVLAEELYTYQDGGLETENRVREPGVEGLVREGRELLETIR